MRSRQGHTDQTRKSFQARSAHAIEELARRCERLEETQHRHTIDIAHLRLARDTGVRMGEVAMSRASLKCDILEAQHIHDHVLWIRFRDIAGRVDISPVLQDPLFQPLRDVEYFKMFSLDRLVHTLRWPNGAHLAPEFLRAKREGVLRALASEEPDRGMDEIRTGPALSGRPTASSRRRAGRQKP